MARASRSWATTGMRCSVVQAVRRRQSSTHLETRQERLRPARLTPPSMPSAPALEQRPRQGGRRTRIRRWASSAEYGGRTTTSTQSTADQTAVRGVPLYVNADVPTALHAVRRSGNGWKPGVDAGQSVIDEHAVYESTAEFYGSRPPVARGVRGDRWLLWRQGVASHTDQPQQCGMG
jgi:hypothetical protein